MKKLILTVISITVFYGMASAQHDANGNIKEESSIKYDGKPYEFIFSWNKQKKARPIRSHWPWLGLSFNHFTNMPDDVGMNLGKSCSFILNIGHHDMRLSNHLLFSSGVGLDFSHFRFKNNFALQEIDGITCFSPDLQGRDYISSRLTVYYITFPLMFEYQTGAAKNNFFMQGGAEVLFKYYARSKVEVATRNGISKEKFDDLNILPINYRLVGRLGFGSFGFFISYQPVSMFLKGKGPDMHPYAAGISLH